MKWSELSTEERDRLVHAKVAGIPTCPGKAVTVAGGWQCIVCGAWGLGEIPKWHEATYETIPRYSTDMNAAWQIVELEKFSSVEVKRLCLSEIVDRPYKYLCHINAYGQLVCAYGETAQEAICIAALMAYGIEIEP